MSLLKNKTKATKQATPNPRASTTNANERNCKILHIGEKKMQQTFRQFNISKCREYSL